MYAHGMTFGGHPVQCAVALKNIEIMKRDGIVEHVAANEERFRSTLGQLLDLDDRRRSPRRRLLLGARARQGQGDEGDVLGRGVRVAAPRLPLAAPLRARTDLPRRRPWRPGRPDLAAARRRPRAVRRDRRHPRRRPRRGRGSPRQAAVDASGRRAGPVGPTRARVPPPVRGLPAGRGRRRPRRRPFRRARRGRASRRTKPRRAGPSPAARGRRGWRYARRRRAG